MAFQVQSNKNFVCNLLHQKYGPLQLWQWLGIVALILYLDRKNIIDLPLIGGQKKVIRNKGGKQKGGTNFFVMFLVIGLIIAVPLGIMWGIGMAKRRRI